MSAVINSEFQDIFFNLMYVILNFAEGFIQSFCIPVFFKYFLILKNVSVFMSESFHRANHIKSVPSDVEKSADSGSGLKKIHLQAKWRVMKNPDFSKNPDF